MKVLCRSFWHAPPYEGKGTIQTRIVELGSDGTDSVRETQEGSYYRHFHLFLETILPEDVYCVHFSTQNDAITIYYRVREES